MIVRYNTLRNFDIPTFTLCSPGSVYNNGLLSNVVGILVDHEAEEIVFNFNSTSELNLRVNRVIREDKDENVYTYNLYIELSCNPIISRPNPTSNKIIMTVSGNFYRGSFGKHTNTLKLQYRYKESGGSYGDWNTVDSTLITYGTSSYKSTSEIELF